MLSTNGARGVTAVRSLQASSLNIVETTLVNERRPGASDLQFGGLNCDGFDKQVVLDGSGLYGLVGLRGDHVHINSAEDLRAFIRSGVTSITEMAGSPWHRSVRDYTTNNELLAPSICQATPPLDGPGLRSTPIAGRGIIINSNTKSEELLPALQGHGYDFVKFYDELGVEQAHSLAASCRLLGFPFGGHCPRWADWADFAELGASRIDHMIGVWRGNSALRDVELSSKNVQLHLTDRDIELLASSLVRHGTTMCPTLIVYMSVARRATLVGGSLPEMRRDVADAWDEALEAETSEEAEAKEEYLAFLQRLVSRFHALGVTITAGTDCPDPFVPPGQSLAAEVELLAEAMGSASHALLAATVPTDTSVGTLSSGITLYGEDPRDDLNVLRRPVGVCTANGVLVDLESGLLERCRSTPRASAVVDVCQPWKLPATNSIDLFEGNDDLIEATFVGEYATLRAGIWRTGNRITLCEEYATDYGVSIERWVEIDGHRSRLLSAGIHESICKSEVSVDGHKVDCRRYLWGEVDNEFQLHVELGPLFPTLACSLCLPWVLATSGLIAPGEAVSLVGAGDLDREWAGMERGVVARLIEGAGGIELDYKESSTGGVVRAHYVGLEGSLLPRSIVKVSNGTMKVVTSSDD